MVVKVNKIWTYTFDLANCCSARCLELTKPPGVLMPDLMLLSQNSLVNELLESLLRKKPLLRDCSVFPRATKANPINTFLSEHNYNYISIIIELPVHHCELEERICPMIWAAQKVSHMTKECPMFDGFINMRMDFKKFGRWAKKDSLLKTKKKQGDILCQHLWPGSIRPSMYWMLLFATFTKGLIYLYLGSFVQDFVVCDSYAPYDMMGRDSERALQWTME